MFSVSPTAPAQWQTTAKGFICMPPYLCTTQPWWRVVYLERGWRAAVRFVPVMVFATWAGHDCGYFYNGVCCECSRGCATLIWLANEWHECVPMCAKQYLYRLLHTLKLVERITYYQTLERIASVHVLQCPKCSLNIQTLCKRRSHTAQP